MRKWVIFGIRRCFSIGWHLAQRAEGTFCRNTISSPLTKIQLNDRLINSLSDWSPPTRSTPLAPPPPPFLCLFYSVWLPSTQPKLNQFFWDKVAGLEEYFDTKIFLNFIHSSRISWFRLFQNLGNLWRYLANQKDKQEGVLIKLDSLKFWSI